MSLGRSRAARAIALTILVGGVPLVTQAGMPGVGASEGGDRSLFGYYRCDGALVNFLPADAETVRKVGRVPPEFKLANEDTGTTTLFFWQLYCDGLLESKHGWLEGTAAGAGLTANLDVHPDSPPGSASPLPSECASCEGGRNQGAGYDIWQLTNDAPFAAFYTRVGVPVEHVRHLSVSFEEVNGFPVAAHVKAPWEHSPYEVRARITPGPVPLPVPNECAGESSADGCIPSFHWVNGPLGHVYTENANCGLSTAEAHTTIEAKPGSPLARMLGGSRIEAPGFWLRIGTATTSTDDPARFESGEAPRPYCEPWPPDRA